MNTLTYGLSQHVGIFYYDDDWLAKVYQNIHDHYPSEYFDSSGTWMSFNGDAAMYFKDGSSIRFFKNFIVNRKEEGSFSHG